MSGLIIFMTTPIEHGAGFIKVLKQKLPGANKNIHKGKYDNQRNVLQ
jgi:hypothetical protein